MCKCLECKNYKKSGKVHRCAVNPGTVYYSDSYPSEPIVESCGKYEKLKFHTSTSSKYRR